MHKCASSARPYQQRLGHMRALCTDNAAVQPCALQCHQTHKMLTRPLALQDAVRGDHGEVAQLLINHGGKIFKTAENRLVDLNRSHLAG